MSIDTFQLKRNAKRYKDITINAIWTEILAILPNSNTPCPCFYQCAVMP